MQQVPAGGVFLLAAQGCMLCDWHRSTRVHWEEIMGQGTAWISRGSAVEYLIKVLGFVFSLACWFCGSAAQAASG